MDIGYVYFVAYDNAVWRRALPVVKIGTTYDLNKRKAQLSTGSPVELVYAGVIETSNPKRLEYSLHARFAYAKFKGEWFDVGRWPMLNELKTLKIKDSRIEEFFGSWDEPSKMQTDMPLYHEAKAGNIDSKMRAELKEKDALIEKMSARLAEIDPLAYKLLPKKSCRPPGALIWHFNHP